MNNTDFRAKRRQSYLSEDSFVNTIAFYDHEYKPLRLNLNHEDIGNKAKARILGVLANGEWNIFQLRFTAGENLTILANSLTDIVEAYERYAEALLELPDEDCHPPFILNDMIDTYVNYLHLLCFAILLHREDLIPRIHALNEGTDFEGADAVIEELLKFYLSDRPVLDVWLWDKPYRNLLDAIDSDTPAEMAKGMKKHVKGWYSGMKGQAHFWGKHEQIKPEFTPYEGYWAMCAAAFTYLYDIDDASYRDEIVYPKDLVDYARSKPRRTSEEAAKLVPQELRRVEGGQSCPQSGYWFTPADGGMWRKFTQGDIMPKVQSDYGCMIWYWSPEQ